MTRTAVVLMNLGGPDSPDAVEPFLFNLFSDRAIIDLPAILRLPLARLIARRRARVANEIYRQLGGFSPLLANTRAQAQTLEQHLGADYRCFIAMRYWYPTSAETAGEVKDWAPDAVVCLPLYPQFSTTTTASSLRAWRLAVAEAKFAPPTHTICCYPDEKGFVEAIVELIRPALVAARAGARPPRLLLTAHGLPQKIVARGDPYPQQVERTAAAIAAVLADPGLDWRVCYQSRVGPLKWIGPATDDEIRRAGAEGVPLVVAPIAFVSEHSETLVELDRDYRRIAEECHVPVYLRVATVGTEPPFIEALASLVRRSGQSERLGACPPGECALIGAAS